MNCHRWKRWATPWLAALFLGPGFAGCGDEGGAPGDAPDGAGAVEKTEAVDDGSAGTDPRASNPVWWAEVAVKWHPATEFAVIGEVLYGRDNNRTQVERNAQGHAERVFTEPNVVAVNVLGQFLF